MLSFKEYLIESMGEPGNYVCAHCNFPVFPEYLYPKSGIKSDKEPHITLMYSEDTNVDERVLKSSLNTIPAVFDLLWDHVTVFDSSPDEDNPDVPVSAVVLKVKSPVAVNIHESLKSLGMVHSYEEFSPHVTIAYRVHTDEAWQVASDMNMWINENRESLSPLITTRVEFSPINKNWVNSL